MTIERCDIARCHSSRHSGVYGPRDSVLRTMTDASARCLLRFCEFILVGLTVSLVPKPSTSKSPLTSERGFGMSLD